MLLKICGLRERENVEAISSLKPQWMGFIFEPASPRYYEDAKDKAVLAQLDKTVKMVGVFVNQPEQVIINTCQKYQLDLVQLHGDESVEFCKALKAKGVQIIKAFRISEGFDFTRVDEYAPYADLFLFDTAGKLFGGNGTMFNWQLLQNHRFGKPFILSGGIGPADTEMLNNFKHPDMVGVDVNSKFEMAPGIKNVAALQLFKQQIS